jgi:Co/Zn/Cd efflux system component
VGTNEPNVPAVVVDNHVTDERRHEKTNVNVNVRAAIIHAIGDLIQSIGVFAAAMIIYFKVSRCNSR